MAEPEPSLWRESPADLRARAERFRKLAWEFPPGMRSVVLEVVAELEAQAAQLDVAGKD